jgi:branched-chain amino acid transport system permease protein
MAAAVGVNTRLINMWTFAFGSALAGAGGALLAPLAGVVPNMGQAYIARAFMTVIVGGAGVLSGTSSAAALLGGVEYAVSYLSNPFFGQGALLILAILLLRVMPTGVSGFFGRQL